MNISKAQSKMLMMNLRRVLCYFTLIGSGLFCTYCFLSSPLHAVEGLSLQQLQSVSIRTRVSEKTTLGKDAPEDFKAYDVSMNFELPWQNYSTIGWGMGTRLSASAGMLEGVGKKAVVVSLIPELTLGREDGLFILDLGVGGALFSRYRFGVQDYGGPFQFALTVGVSFAMTQELSLGYRFLHYSDAGVNGPDTTGADFHMIMLNYRF